MKGSPVNKSVFPSLMIVCIVSVGGDVEGGESRNCIRSFSATRSQGSSTCGDSNCSYQDTCSRCACALKHHPGDHTCVLYLIGQLGLNFNVYDAEFRPTNCSSTPIDVVVYGNYSVNQICSDNEGQNTCLHDSMALREEKVFCRGQLNTILHHPGKEPFPGMVVPFEGLVGDMTHTTNHNEKLFSAANTEVVETQWVHYSFSDGVRKRKFKAQLFTVLYETRERGKILKRIAIELKDFPAGTPQSKIHRFNLSCSQVLRCQGNYSFCLNYGGQTVLLLCDRID